MRLEFFISGLPAGAGSKRGIPLKKNGQFTGRVAMIDMSGEKGKIWRGAINQAAFTAMREQQCPLFTEPVILRVEFILPRPKNHYVANDPSRDLRDTAPKVHSSRPDATKLVRQLEDSLTGVAWLDDALVAEQHVYKRYGSFPGAKVTIQSWSDEQVIRKSHEEFCLTSPAA